MLNRSDFDRAFAEIKLAAFQLRQRCRYHAELNADLRTGGPDVVLEQELQALHGELRRWTDELADRIETLYRLLFLFIFGFLPEKPLAEAMARQLLVLVILPRIDECLI